MITILHNTNRSARARSVVIATLLSSTSSGAWAGCSTTGTTWDCNLPTQTTEVGTYTTNNITLTVQNGGATPVIAIPQGTNTSAIRLGTGTTINVNGIVQNNATAGGSETWGPNTVTINSGTINVETTGQILSLGTVPSGEAIALGSGPNIINNRGLISANGALALWAEVNGGLLTFNNYGTIAHGARTPNQTASVIGGGDVQIDFHNYSGGQVFGSFELASSSSASNFTLDSNSFITGNLNLGSGNDTLTLQPGAEIRGATNGGGGTNALNLTGDSGPPGTLPGAFNGFGLLRVKT